MLTITTTLPILLALLLLSPVTCSDPAPANRALLALERRVEGDLVAGRNATVHYTIHNVGTRPASEIALKDRSFPLSRFETFSGAFRRNWTTLPNGDSVTMEVLMRPRRAGILLVSPASVSYVDEDGAARMSKLASEDTVLVEDLMAFRRRTDRHRLEWGAFAGAFVALVLLPFLVSVMSEGAVVGEVTGGKKRN